METRTLNFRQGALARFQSFIALAAMVLAMTLLSNKFLTADNVRIILVQISVNICLSVGMTLVVLTGGIDLSVGAILALSGAVAAGLLKNGLAFHHLGLLLQFTVFGAILAGVMTGIVSGCFNGIMITRLSVPPFVATLGMLSIARGLTMLWTGGFTLTRPSQFPFQIFFSPPVFGDGALPARMGGCNRV